MAKKSQYPKSNTLKWNQDRGCFLGRNGIFKCRGISITSNQKDLYLEPITSKGTLGRCLLCIPIDQAPALAKAIKEIL